MPTTQTLLDGLSFSEGPRWHQGRLWFSDMYQGQVMAVDLEGKVEIICHVENEPSGLGFLPDGRLLVVSMQDRRLLRLDGSELVEVADLSAHATFHCNDMLVDGQGRAYVGNFGYDLHGGAELVPAKLVRVDPDGSVHVAADELRFPNGTALTPDGKTLIIGETFGACLTAFDVAPDGALSNRRLWAQLQAAVPDGICLDAEGCVWVASPVGHKVLRVREGGEVTQQIDIETEAFACMLGGPERKTLFICTAATSDPNQRDQRTSRIETVEVGVPGAGLP